MKNFTLISKGDRENLREDHLPRNSQSFCRISGKELRFCNGKALVLILKLYFICNNMIKKFLKIGK